MLGAIVKHLLYNAVHITFLHHLFVFCAVKEFYINPCSINVMRDIVSGVKDDILTAVDQFPVIAAVRIFSHLFDRSLCKQHRRHTGRQVDLRCKGRLFLRLPDKVLWHGGKILIGQIDIIAADLEGPLG